MGHFYIHSSHSGGLNTHTGLLYMFLMVRDTRVNVFIIVLLLWYLLLGLKLGKMIALLLYRLISFNSKTVYVRQRNINNYLFVGAHERCETPRSWFIDLLNCKLSERALPELALSTSLTADALQRSRINHSQGAWGLQFTKTVTVKRLFFRLFAVSPTQLLPTRAVAFYKSRDQIPKSICDGEIMLVLMFSRFYLMSSWMFGSERDWLELFHCLCSVTIQILL